MDKVEVEPSGAVNLTTDYYDVTFEAAEDKVYLMVSDIDQYVRITLDPAVFLEFLAEVSKRVPKPTI